MIGVQTCPKELRFGDVFVVKGSSTLKVAISTKGGTIRGVRYSCLTKDLGPRSYGCISYDGRRAAFLIGTIELNLEKCAEWMAKVPSYRGELLPLRGAEEPEPEPVPMEGMPLGGLNS